MITTYVILTVQQNNGAKTMKEKTYIVTEYIYGGMCLGEDIVVCDDCLKEMKPCRHSKHYKADKDCECDICGKV